MAAIGTTAYGEALSLALRNFLSNKPINQTYTEHPLFDTLKKNASSATGPRLVVPVIGGSVAQPSFSSNGSGLFAPTVTDEIAGSAEYSWSRPLVGFVRVRYQDLEENAGKTQLADRLRVHIDDLLEQTKVKIVDLLHTENGSLPSGSFSSLDTLCNDAVTTVGGINYTTSGNSFWRPVTETAPSTDPKVAIRTMVQNITKNAKGVRPDVVHVGENMWNAIQEYIDSKATITSGIGGTDVELSWQSVSFGGIEVRWDYDCPDDRAYFLHTPSLYFKYLTDNFMKSASAKQVNEAVAGVVNTSLDEVFPVVTIMSVGTSQRRALGMIEGFTAGS
jgi:hypothetical protein